MEAIGALISQPMPEAQKEFLQAHDDLLRAGNQLSDAARSGYSGSGSKLLCIC